MAAQFNERFNSSVNWLLYRFPRPQEMPLYMPRPRYIRWIIASIVLLLLATILFRYLLWAIVITLAGGSCSGGACGALGVVVGVFGKPLLLLLFLGVTFYAFSRRMKAFGSPLWLAYPALVLLASAGTLFAVGNFWGANFVTGILFSPRPPSLSIFNVFALIVVLCLPLEAGTNFRGSLTATRWPGEFPVGWLYAASCAIIAVNEVLRGIAYSIALDPEFWDVWWRQPFDALGWLRSGFRIPFGKRAFMFVHVSYVNIANLALLVWMVFSMLRDPPANRGLTAPRGMLGDPG